MKTENKTPIADRPVEISDAAWKSILPFLKTLPNVYVGNPETCRNFLSALVWMTKEGTTWRGWFRRFMDTGIASIAASGDGAMPGFLKNFINISMMRVNSQRFSLILQSCEPILLRPGTPKKKEDKTQQLSDAVEADSPRNFTCL